MTTPTANATANPASPPSEWSELMTRVHELKDLGGLQELVEWESETYAPPGARAARGPQVATLAAIRHQKLTDPALSAMLRDATPPDAESEILVTRVRREVDQATRLPERLVKALAEARSAALPAWEAARRDADFSAFAPHLEAQLPLLRDKGAALASGDQTPYDALLDTYEPEMTTEVLRPVLEDLRRGLVPIVEALTAAEPPPHGFLGQRFDDDAQWKLTLQILEDLGFDFQHGRQDRSTHPFSCSVNERDVRVTTRVDESNLLSSLSSTIHECGHALYEQGFDPRHYRTPLAAAPSMGIHESQSRLWENQVGLSRPFWDHYYPQLQAAFPQLSGVDVETFWRGINAVRRSLIRVDADEVTYNLHIVLRFELELAMIRGDLPVAELPGAWSDGMERLLGIRPANDAEGCLQDIHWPMGAFGYFPTYSLGNLYAAQLFDAFRRDHPAADEYHAEGRFAPLLQWLRDRIHRRGHTASAQTIIADAVGAPLSVDPFLRYLRAKYRSVYGVDL